MTPEKLVILVATLGFTFAGPGLMSARAADAEDPAARPPAPSPLPAKEGRPVLPTAPLPIAAPAAPPAPFPIPTPIEPKPSAATPAPSAPEPDPPTPSYTASPPDKAPPPAASTAPPATSTSAQAPDPYGWRPPEGRSNEVRAKPKPVGFDDAVKLYNQSKFAQALAKLNGFVKYGTDNDDVHFYIAACHQGLKQYDKAIKEYDTLAKNTPFLSTRKKATAASYTIKCYRNGICPGQCLKPNDPRWRYDRGPGADPFKKVITYYFRGGKVNLDEKSIGHVIIAEGGNPPIDKGNCPICNGTTRVARLK